MSLTSSYLAERLATAASLALGWLVTSIGHSLPENNPNKLIYVRELDSELPLDQGHLDRVSRRITKHEAGEALLQRIRGLLKLRAQRLLRNMFELERLATDFFKSGDNFKWTQRAGASKFDNPPFCRRMPQSQDAHFGNVQERDPTHRAGAGSIDTSGRIQIIESKCWAQPYFHEKTSLNDRKVKSGDCVLDPRFRLCQREGNTGWAAK